MRLSLGNITLLNIRNLIPTVIALIILVQNRSSITWYTTFYATSLLVIFLFYLTYKGKNTIFFPNKLSILALFLSIISFVVLNFQTSSIITLIAFVTTFTFKGNMIDKAINILTTLSSFIIGISFFFWILHFNDIFSVPLYQHLDLSIIGNPGFLEDYIFFVNSPELIFPRFYSIFEEPGALGVLLTLIIVANKYNFKDIRIIILVIGLVFTYSLAGYITFFAGLFFNKIKNIKILITSFIVLIIILGVLYILFKDVEELQWLIFDRISNFEERGLESRNSSDLNKFFSTYIFSTSSILGMGEGYSGGHFTGSSYKFFLIDYGWIGIISVLLIYLSIYIKYGYKTFPVLFVYFLAFLPQYRAFISWQIILFVLSSYSYSKNENTNSYIC